MSFEKIHEIIIENDLRAKKEVSDFYSQMKELDNEVILTNDNENKDFTETNSKKIDTISFKSEVNPEKDMTLNVAI